MEMSWCYSPKHYNLTEGDSSVMVVSFHLSHHFGSVHATLLGRCHQCPRPLGQLTHLQGPAPAPAPALGSSALSTLAQRPGGLCWCLQRVGFDPCAFPSAACSELECELLGVLPSQGLAFPEGGERGGEVLHRGRAEFAKHPVTL